MDISPAVFFFFPPRFYPQERKLAVISQKYEAMRQCGVVGHRWAGFSWGRKRRGRGCPLRCPVNFRGGGSGLRGIINTQLSGPHPALRRSSGVTLNESHLLSEAQLPYLQNKEWEKNAQPTGLSRGSRGGSQPKELERVCKPPRNRSHVHLAKFLVRTGCFKKDRGINGG